MTTFSGFKTFLLSLVMLTALSAAASRNTPPGPPAEEIVEEEEVVAPLSVDVAAAVDSICSAYDSDWKELSMQGKLSFSGLPVRPNIKIYMKRGESVIMSARAPIFGEVARVEINPDSVTCINKHTGVYCSYPLASIAPGMLADLQDVLLGQVAFPTHGRLTGELADASEWMPVPGDRVMLYPSPQLQLPGTEYAFVLDSENWQLLQFALMVSRAKALLETTYDYGDTGWTLGLNVTLGDKTMQGSLQLSYPDYAPTPLSFTDAGAKYRKTDFRGLMRF